MKNQINPSNVSVRFIKEKDVFAIRIGNQSELISANFIRFQLGIPYTKKDGTLVTSQDIQIANDKAQRAYADAVVAKFKW